MTRLLEYTREAFEALWRNRTRSILTMLGMIIGTASVIAVFGISKASSSGISAEFASFGRPSIWLQTDYQQNFPAQAAIQYRDIATIRDYTAGLAGEVEPFYTRTWNVRVGNKSGFEGVSSTSGYAPGDLLLMQEGRKITEHDVAAGAHVVTMTADLATKYFPNGDATGQNVSLNGSRFTVLGVYSPIKGSAFNAISGSGFIIPYTTMYRITNSQPDGALMYAIDGVSDDAAIAAAKDALVHIHGPTSRYVSQSGGAFLSTFQNVLNVVAAGLSGIGAVALLVAGIGVMNIMLVSVVERTREIGIRKSIGASTRDIATQFLIEAVLLALFGGGIGFALGLLVTIGGASYISTQLGAAIIPYVLLVCLALAFSLGIGLVFGSYPALRAARLDPIEAIRS